MEPKELIEAGEKIGLRLTEVPLDLQESFPVVNLWVGEPGERYPLTSITWPDPERPQFNTYAWGPHFEYEESADVCADALAESVKATMTDMLTAERAQK